MIGGTMLLFGVGAMILIALWSLECDDLPLDKQNQGLLALRVWSDRTVRRKHGTPFGSRQQQRRAEANMPAEDIPEEDTTPKGKRRTRRPAAQAKTGRSPSRRPRRARP